MIFDVKKKKMIFGELRTFFFFFFSFLYNCVQFKKKKLNMINIKKIMYIFKKKLCTLDVDARVQNSCVLSLGLTRVQIDSTGS